MTDHLTDQMDQVSGIERNLPQPTPEWRKYRFILGHYINENRYKEMMRIEVECKSANGALSQARRMSDAFYGEVGWGSYVRVEVEIYAGQWERVL